MQERYGRTRPGMRLLVESVGEQVLSAPKCLASVQRRATGTDGRDVSGGDGNDLGDAEEAERTGIRFPPPFSEDPAPAYPDTWPPRAPQLIRGRRSAPGRGRACTRTPPACASRTAASSLLLPGVAARPRHDCHLAVRQCRRLSIPRTPPARSLPPRCVRGRPGACGVDEPRIAYSHGLRPCGASCTGSVGGAGGTGRL